MTPVRHFFAHFPGVCPCGATFEEGADVLYDPDRRAIVGCPACNWTGRARAETSDLRGGMRGVAAALRKRREKEAKRRATP